MIVFKNNQVKSCILIFGVFATVVLVLNFTMETPLFAFITLSLGTTSILFSTHSKQKVKKISFKDDFIVIQKYARPFHLQQMKYYLVDVAFSEDINIVGEFSWSKRVCGKDKLGNILFIISTEFALWEEDQLKDILQTASIFLERLDKPND